MKYIFSLLLLFIYLISSGQSTGRPENSSATLAVPSNYFLTHKELAGNPFYQQLNKEPANAATWLQLYQSVVKSGMNKHEKKTLLQQTTQAAGNYIRGSWQFSLIRFLQSGRRDSSFIHEALAYGEANKQLYPYAIQWASIAGNKSLLKEYCEALYQLSPLSAIQYEYHYNALMSAEKNARIYAKGITDLVPMLLLQQVFHIRPDIDLQFYDENIKPAGNAYLCLSLGKETIEKYANASYTGLLVKLKAADASSLASNLEQQFAWQQLEAVSSLSDTDKLLYRNYLPALIILYKQYVSANDPRSASWKLKIEKIAALTGTTAIVYKQMAP